MMWGDYGYHHPMAWGGYGGGFGIVDAFFSIFWLVVGIVALVYLIRYLRHSKHFRSSEKSALDILKERYAKGEIDKAEFEEKKKALSE